MPTIHFNRDRRRSSFTRPMRDPEEILEGLRSLKAAKRELGRTMSLSGDKRRESREYGYVASLFFLGLNHFRLNRSKSFAPPFQFRSSIRADCLPAVYLSLSHTRSSIYFYILRLLLRLSLLFFSHHHHHHGSRSLDRRSARSILVHQPIEADRIFLIGRRRAYRTHANNCVCTDVHVCNPCVCRRRGGVAKSN